MLKTASRAASSAQGGISTGAPPALATASMYFKWQSAFAFSGWSISSRPQLRPMRGITMDAPKASHARLQQRIQRGGCDRGREQAREVDQLPEMVMPMRDLVGDAVECGGEPLALEERRTLQFVVVQ